MDPFLSTWLISPVWSELVARLLPVGAEKDVRRLVHQLTLQALESEPGLRALDCESERISAALTITLTALDAAGMDSDLDPDLLVERMRRAAPEATEGLTDERALALYDVLSLGACTHLVEHFAHLPEFQSRTLVEIRRRLAVLQHQVAAAGKASADYEQVYREAPPEQADEPAFLDLTVRNGEHGSRLEDLLAVHPRLLLEGPAGAGKTTLLQHLARRIRERDLPEPLAEWRDERVVPFVLRPRRFMERDGLRLPSPEEFDGAGDGAGKPETWVTELLRQRRAIVMVDGVDEIPAAYRPELMAWVEDLTRLYPGVRFLLTTRPDALDAGQRAGFVTCHLEPMSTIQVDEFIRRRLGERAGRLIGVLAARRDLARLATNPLLCAMLCTVDGAVPPGRHALYEAALPFGEREALGRVALWMTLNGRRTAGRDTAPHVTGSTLLRETAEGLLEFSHPSFQDHLAAAEFCRDQTLDHLIHNAQDPFYRDVIVMVAGQSRECRERLLDGLTKQALAEDDRMLWLLAAACVADADEHAALIRERTRRLLPPRTLEEAHGLAKAGGFVFDLVADVAAGRHLTAEEAAATIQVAILTGGDDAIPLLRGFARHPAKEVRKALVDAWFGSRVPERYVAEVLSGCSLNDIVVVLPGLEYLSCLDRLSGLRHLDLTRTGIADLGPLCALTSLRHLYLATTRGVRNVGLLRDAIPDLKIMS